MMSILFVKLKSQIQDPIFWAKLLGYVVPVGFLLYVLNLHFLPFGYQETFKIHVGSGSDTKVSEFYIEPTQNLSESETDEKGNSYRELDGEAHLIFNPKTFLKNATVTIESPDNGISIRAPHVLIDPSSIQWDKTWDLSTSTPSELTNNGVINFDGVPYFDGSGRLELPNSSDKFEDGPFTIYAEWQPINSEENFQEIIGHFNWEVLQYKDSVRFQVGRMENASGTVYSVRYPVTPDFFGQRHTVIAIYSPSDEGYIELYVDGSFAGRQYFGKEKIWQDYGKDNLSLGWTSHNYATSPHFRGYIYNARIVEKNVFPDESKATFRTDIEEEVDISVFAKPTSSITNLELHVSK